MNGCHVLQSHPFQVGRGSNAGNPSTWAWRQENQKFKGSQSSLHGGGQEKDTEASTKLTSRMEAQSLLGGSVFHLFFETWYHVAQAGFKLCVAKDALDRLSHLCTTVPGLCRAFCVLVKHYQPSRTLTPKLLYAPLPFLAWVSLATPRGFPGPAETCLSKEDV